MATRAIKNIKNNSNASRNIDWGSFFVGILIVIAGIVVLAWPNLTLVMLATIAGIGFLAAAVYDLIKWWNMREVSGAAWTLLSGICDAVIGIMFLVNPIIGAGVLTFMIGCFVLVYGCFSLVTSFGIRNAISSWWVMLLNGIVAILCGFLFIFSPEFFAIYLAIFLMMRGVTMSTYSVLAPNQIGRF